ncbi:MAG TPA: hypothetical protein VIY86_09575, partial [Pirellulaceae bacterium]
MRKSAKTTGLFQEMTTWNRDRKGNVRRRRSPFARRFFGFENLESRRLLASDLTEALQTIVKDNADESKLLVDAIHDRIFDEVLHGTQPVVKDALKVKDGPDDLFNMLANKVLDAINSLTGLTVVTSVDIRDALANKLSGLIQPGMSIEASCGPTGQKCDMATPANEVRLTLPLRGTVVEKDTTFDLGLPQLLTTSPGNVRPRLTYDADLVLGFSESKNAFLDTAPAANPTNDVRLTLDVPSVNLAGRLGILKFNAIPVDMTPPLYHATFNVDIQDSGDSDSLLVVGEIGSMQTKATRVGDVKLHTNLTFDMGTAIFPTLSTRLL